MENLKNSKLLVVDDTPINIQIISSILQKTDYLPQYAKNGQEALEKAFSNDFDIILLDIMMPRMDGFEVCRKLKENPKTSDVPILFLSARTDANSIVKGFEVGGADYVTKPFNPQELLSRIRQHLLLRKQKQMLEKMNQTLEEKVLERTQQLTRANERLSRLDKAKNDFLFLINHELRTPLNGMFGFLTLLENTEKTEKQERFLKMLKDSAIRLNELSEFAILITSIKAESYKTKNLITSLKLFIEETLQKHTKQAQQKNVSFKNNLENNDLQASFDNQLLKKALKILIDNAIENSPQGETIQIETRTNDENFTISVLDNGKGFSQQALEQVFDFFAADDVTFHSKGFGLGLATAHLIASTMNGSLDVKNRPQGGAKVSITLPLNA